MSAPNVKFKRQLKPGVEPGSDVRAVKIVVSRLGCWPWMQFDNIWHTGPKTFSEQAMPCIKKKMGQPSGNIYDTKLHSALLAEKVTSGPHEGEWAWNQTAINLYVGFQDLSAAEKIVDDMFAEWDCMVKYASIWHYTQRRPIDYTTPCNDSGGADCSGTVLRCAERGGAKSPDPIWGYSGPGNTDSLRHGGFAISEADVGKYCQDHIVLAFFGPSWDETDHVIVARRPDLWYSDGSEQAPETWPTIFRDPGLYFLGCRAYPVI